MRIQATCKEVHRLVSEGMDRKLSLHERLRMQLHLWICTACSNFNTQMALIRRSMRRLEVPDNSDADQQKK